MSNKPNHVCKICEKEYYFCDYCGQQLPFTPYKSICCSFKCYQQYVDATLEVRGEFEAVTAKQVASIDDFTISTKMK